MLIAAYPHRDIPTVSIEIYYDLLREYDADELTKGVREAIKKCNFFPSIADIRQEIIRHGFVG